MLMHVYFSTLLPLKRHSFFFSFLNFISYTDRQRLESQLLEKPSVLASLVSETHTQTPTFRGQKVHVTHTGVHKLTLLADRLKNTLLGHAAVCTALCNVKPEEN